MTTLTLNCPTDLIKKLQSQTPDLEQYIIHLMHHGESLALDYKKASQEWHKEQECWNTSISDGLNNEAW